MAKSQSQVSLAKRMERLGKYILVFALTIFLLFVIVPLLSSIFIPMFIYRWVISKLATCFKSDELGKIVTARSALLGMRNIYNEHALTSMVTLELAEPFPDIHKFRNLIEKNALAAVDPKSGLPIYPELKQTLKTWMGFYFWAKVDHFDVKEHAYYLKDAPSITDKWTDKQDVIKLLLKIIRHKKWVKGKPLWEFIFIPNVPREVLGLDATTDPTCSLLFFRMHHTMGDGLCILKLLSRIFEDFKAVDKVAKPNYMKTRRNCVAQIFVDVYCFLKAPFELVDFILTKSPLSHNVTMPEFETGNTRSDISGATSLDIPLQYLKDIKNMHDVDFNSLIFAMVAGGVRHMMVKHSGESKLPKDITIGFPLPMPGHPDNKLRNHLSFGTILLPIGDTDPVKRIQKLHKRIIQLKTSTLPMTTSVLHKCLGSLPFAVLRSLAPSDGIIAPLLLTNLLGPAEEMTVLGSSILGLRVGSNAPVDGPPGYAFMFIAYNGNGRLVTGALNKYLPTGEDAEELLQHSLEQLEILSQAGTV